MWRALIHRMSTKRRVKYEQIKKKTGLFFVFCKYMFKFQENKFKIIQKNF